MDKWFQTKGAWPVVLAAVLFVIALIWLSMWLGGPSQCAMARGVRIGETMLVAGCK